MLNGTIVCPFVTIKLGLDTSVQTGVALIVGVDSNTKALLVEGHEKA
jgi:hypothetical protein